MELVRSTRAWGWAVGTSRPRAEDGPGTKEGEQSTGAEGCISEDGRSAGSGDSGRSSNLRAGRVLWMP